MIAAVSPSVLYLGAASTGVPGFSIGEYLRLPFAQHALLAAALVAVVCGLVGPFVVARQMAFAVHGTSELAFTGAAGGLLVANDAVAGALVGSLVVAGLIAALGVRERERDSSIGVILAAGLALGALLLTGLANFASAATNILFGQLFGVSGAQLTLLLAVGLFTLVSMVVVYRPLLFASVDPEGATARGVRVRLVGLIFLVVLALSVTEAAQVVGTIFVLSLAITPAAAATRLSANPLVVAAASVGFALTSAVGGLLLDFDFSSVKPSVFIVGISTGLYLGARLAGPYLRTRRKSRQQEWQLA